MSAFNPPKYLDKQDIKSIADVRRTLWTGGFQGMAFGLVAGCGGWFAAKYTNQLPTHMRHPNFLFGATLGSGALCMYLGATLAGKNQMWHINDVVTKHAKPPPRQTEGASDYRAQLAENERDKLADTAAFERRQSAIRRFNTQNPMRPTGLAAASEKIDRAPE
ncbi:hypothetical protein M885DRAFT_616163 [Pelagophyceae sp. CCMP2097]|nr:hypothetical protein M885DRAFT_616163 [Pelagophyceae sp. CCMP2097]